VGGGGLGGGLGGYGNSRFGGVRVEKVIRGGGGNGRNVMSERHVLRSSRCVGVWLLTSVSLGWKGKR